MKKIGLLSDTHSTLHPRLYEFFNYCDEIWHAGDIGDLHTVNELEHFKPLKAVHGNIDGLEIRSVFPHELIFYTETVKVLMVHIGGYPGHYDRSVIDLIRKEAPKLLVTGHSHILKVMYDKKFDLLFINPGAAGNFGFHKSLTMVRFVIDGDQIRDLEVLDIPRNEE